MAFSSLDTTVVVMVALPESSNRVADGRVSDHSGLIGFCRRAMLDQSVQKKHLRPVPNHSISADSRFQETNPCSVCESESIPSRGQTLPALNSAMAWACPVRSTAAATRWPSATAFGGSGMIRDGAHELSSPLPPKKGKMQQKTKMFTFQCLSNHWVPGS